MSDVRVARPEAGPLLQEMVDLRSDLNRERWHKRALVLVVFVVAVLAIWNIYSHSVLNDTVHRLDAATARLDQTVKDLEAQRAATVQGICGSDEALINTFLSLQPPPPDLAAQWIEQARLNEFEKDYEAKLAALPCDLHLDPIKSPVPPAPATGQSARSAPPGTIPLAFVAPLSPILTPRSTTTRPPSTTSPTTSPTTSAPPSTTVPPSVAAPAPTTPNGKPYKGNGNGPHAN